MNKYEADPVVAVERPLPHHVVSEWAAAMTCAEASRTGPDRYDEFHRERFDYVVELCRSIRRTPQPRVLDVGRSTLSEKLRDAFQDVTTLGFPKQLGDRWDHIPHIVYNLNDAQQLAPIDTDKTFDIIVMAEVIEHVYTAPELFLLTLQSILASDGLIVVQTPNAAALHKRLRLLMGRNPYELLRLDPTNPGHYREYTRNELVALGERVGLATVSHSYKNYFASTDINPLARAGFAAACRLNRAFCRGQTIVLTPNQGGRARFKGER